MGLMDKILRRPVVDLAQEVDDALGRLAHARGQQEACRHALSLADGDVRKAEQDVAAARDALFAEHPELAPEPHTYASTGTHNASASDHASTSPETGYEMVAVDDENDPRFTAGVEVSTSDDDPLPPIVWEEHDG